MASRSRVGGAGGIGVLTPIPGDAETIAADVTRLSGAADDWNAAAGVTGGDATTTAGSAHPAPRVVRGPLEEGQTFGSRYHIIRALGVGGMGAVYQAWDAELGVAVAIKVIRPDTMGDPEIAAQVERRFKRELLLARQVTHKNVVRIHDLGEIDGIKYITMTYVDGADLASRLKGAGRLPVPAVMRIARDVVAGLLAAHKAGVVHRDLKPANIAIDKSGDALIMDFGIARSSSVPQAAPASAGGLASMPAAAAEATRFGSVLGTVEYMAPEQAQGKDVDHRADIYALGLMLYDMLVGRERRGTAAANALEELRARMERPPVPAKSLVPEIPDALDRLISRCLEPDPDKRYATTEELAADLNRLDDDGVPIPLPRRFTPRILVAAAVLVAAVIGGTWWLTYRPAPEKPHDPVSVVIADFRNGTKDATFDETLAQTARRALEAASFVSAYDRTNIRLIGVRPAATLDAAAARDVALKQGFGIVLAGAIEPKDSGYEISVTASQTVTGNKITSVSEYAAGKDQVLPAAARLMAKVRKALGDPTSTSKDQLFAMRSITAGSPEAVKYYVAGTEAQAQSNMEAARDNYLKAVQLDPNFGLAYQNLAVMSWNLGRQQDANSYIQEALRHLDSMTDRERYATRGYYDKLIGDNAQCVTEYGELLKHYPADAIAHNGRAACYYNLRKMPEAVAELTEAAKMLPKHAGVKTNLALLTVIAGQFEAAEQQAKALPQNAFTLQVIAYSEIGRGLLPQAADTYQKIGAMGAAGASTAASGLGDLAIYQGRFSEAIGILEKGASDDLKAKNDKAAIKLTAAAYAYLLRGQKPQAIATADRALDGSKSMAVRFLAARVLADAGATDKARKQAMSLSAELPAQPRAYGKIIDGVIALDSGNPSDAVRILNDANGMLDTWFGRFDLGRAYLAAGALPQADAEFDRCIARRGEALTLMDEGPTYGYFPAVYYYQGRVRQGLNTTSFADAYRKYLDIRGTSTEDPVVPDVRKRAAQ